jgi:integrase
VQKGTIRQQHGAWFVLYRVTEIVKGKPVRKQRTARLAPVNADYRSESDVRDLANKLVDRENAGRSTEGAVRFESFVEFNYLPYIEARQKPSTVRFYRDTLKRDVTPVLGSMRLQDVRTVDVQNLLDARNDLSHGSLARIKSATSAVFSFAKRKGFLDANPCQGARAEGQRTDFEGHAYSVKELQFFFETLAEPAKTVVGVAAFTGLRLSEIRGLQWADYTGKELTIRRSVWRTFEGQTKTKASVSTIPVISPLKKMLDAHHKTNGASPWIFAGDKKHFSLNLDNLARRVIHPAVGDRWHGWHGFRRGLSTTLFDLGVDPEISSKILRHSDSRTTRRHYLILSNRKQGKAAMKRLERMVVRKF